MPHAVRTNAGIEDVHKLGIHMLVERRSFRYGLGESLDDRPIDTVVCVCETPLYKKACISATAVNGDRFVLVDPGASCCTRKRRDSVVICPSNDGALASGIIIYVERVSG